MGTGNELRVLLLRAHPELHEGPIQRFQLGRLERDRLQSVMDKDKKISERIVPLSPEVRYLEDLQGGEFPLQKKIRSILTQSAPTEWESTGIDSSYYLDSAELIVRAACDWRNRDGAIVDPVEKKECGQTSPRFVAPGAILLHFGRCEDISGTIYETMDYCCEVLAAGEAQSPDFWMRELVTAWMCLAPITPKERLQNWSQLISSVNPEKIYNQVKPHGNDLEQLHNWTVYAAAGESMRERLGLRPDSDDSVWGEAFFDKYMPAQLTHFTEYGMYRDPNDPITYDITTRLQFATALAFGYEGHIRSDLNELLRRGALTQLLYVSPEGYVPFGGRSSQYQFQEAIISALCELEAVRYRETDSELAGVFKRQAHLSARAVARWLEIKPFRHIKNGFPPEEEWGFDGYGRYSVYSLLTASVFGLAALFADDGIEESPCPADIGGYAFELTPAFHKVFCSCRDTQLEIDTRADFHHDATGLGRFSRRGLPLELGPGMPMTSEAIYKLPEKFRARNNGGIGPSWNIGGEWRRLADYSAGLTNEFSVQKEEPDGVDFNLIWRHSDEKFEVRESYRLKNGRLDYKVHAGTEELPVEGIRLIVPLLATDGMVETRVETDPGLVRAQYRGGGLSVSFDPDLSFEISAETCANRNGLYKYLVVEAPDDTVGAILFLERG
ncbi:MAG: hypothetical protein KGZ25_00145 [Planctomycetes bacterium]|nr:hypothetical protein [Planctomycetota bacterium]